MHSVSIFLSFVASAAAAAITPQVAPLPVGQLGWEGAVAPGGPVMEVWGDSFEDIEAKIKKDYPDFSIYLPKDSPNPDFSPDPSVEARNLLEAREVFGMRNVNCDERYGEIHADDAWEARDNLNRIAGNSCKARARTCIRTQCVNGAAIGICNDNTWDIDIPCTQIASYANNIFNNCMWCTWGCDRRGCDVSVCYTKGQTFSPGLSWNVIVGYCSFFGNGERPVKA